MVKYIRILVILVCFISLNAFAQKATSIALDYDTSGYRENNNSTATLKTVDILAPAIQANMNINEAGALTYSIPIECLKGINNFQPNISLGYNSQAGNGLVGWGWNIIGISTITQGGKSYETDGITIGVQYNDTDPFYLDGQRLLKKSDTEFITQNYSQIKILKGTGEYSFIVKYTDGKVAMYKELSNKQHYLVRISDAFNNEVHYTYNVSNNVVQLFKVSYGGNDVSSDKFYINFTYTERKTPIKIYRNGMAYTNTKVLSEVSSGSTYSGLYRKYVFEFDYVDSNTNERLRTVNVFNTAGESLKPLNFNYNQATNSAALETKKRQLSSFPPNTHKLGDVTFGNFYNTTENDVFYISSIVTDFRSGSEGGFGGSTGTPPPLGNLANPIYKLNGNYGPMEPLTYVNFHTRLFAGKTLINANKITTNDQLILINPVSKTAESLQGQIEVRDLKTGLSKILTGGPSIPWVSSGFQGQQQTWAPPRVSFKQFIPGDFNNDGLFDLIFISGDTASTQKIFLYEIGKETGTTIVAKQFTTTSLLLTDDNYKLLEMDGDGIPEILVISGNQYGLYKINTKDLTITPFGEPLGQNPANILNNLTYKDGKLITPLFIGDFNGDGLSDFLTPQVVWNQSQPFSKLRVYIENTPQHMWWLYTSDGKRFIPSQLDLSQQKIAYIKPSHDEHVPEYSWWDLFFNGPDPNPMKEYAIGNIVITDINNDGKSDIISLSKFGKYKYNDINPIISNITYENVSDLYVEYNYQHSCYDTKANYIPATFISSQQGYKCLSPLFPYYVGPISSGIATVPGTYMTTFPNFNKIKFFINSFDSNNNIIFTKLNQEIDLQGEKITPFSAFISSQDVNFLNKYKSSIANLDVSTGVEYKITINNDNFLEKQIQEVNNGSTVLQKVEYRPMMKLETKEEIAYKYKENNLTYPFYTHQTNGSIYLAHKIHTIFGQKILTSEYRYENAVQSLDGKGFIGFEKTFVSDPYESKIINGKYRNKSPSKPLFWTINTKDPLMDNSLISTTYGGMNTYLRETLLINKKNIIGNQRLITRTDEIAKDNLSKVNTSKKYYYDEADEFKIKKIYTDYNGQVATETLFEYVPEFNNGNHFFYSKIKEQKVTNYKDGLAFRTKTKYLYYPSTGAIQTIEKTSQNSDPIITTNIYYDNGNLKETTTSTIGVADQTTRYTYDISQRYVISTLTADGLTANSVVDITGKASEETSPLGLKSFLAYDNWGNITTITDYLGKKTIISKSISTVNGGVYDLSKKKEGVAEIIVTYDEFDREIQKKEQTINGKWIITKTEYDIFGRKIKLSQPFFEGESIKWNSIEYDAYSRPIKNVTFTNKVYNTCYEGLKVTVDDGYQKTSKTVDAMGNVIRFQDHGGTILYNHFPNGSVREIDYEGNKIIFEIDNWGNKSKIIDPTSGTTTYQYDNLGHLLREDTPKGYTIFEYDNIGRPVFEKSYGNSPAENTNIEKYYVYNTLSKLTEKIYGSSNGKSFTYSTEYDQYYRIKSKKEETPDFTYNNFMTYDPFGRLDEMSISTTILNPNFTTSSRVKNVYDSNGILIQQNDLLLNQAIWHISNNNASKQVTQLEYGNGYVLNEYYNGQDETLLKTTHSNGSQTVLDIDYNFDANKGVLKSRKNNTFNKNEQFEFDILNRLLKETVNGEITNQYTYDKRGRMSGNSELGQYNYNANDYKLQNIAFNAKGQAIDTQRGFAEVTYNGFNSPLTLKLPGKEDLAFEYDLFKSKYSTSSAVSGKRKLYSSDGIVEITRKSGKGGGTLEVITYVTGGPYQANYIKKDVLTLSTSTQVFDNYYLHRDNIGSILAITRSDGAVIEKRYFDAWGNLKSFVNQQGELITDINNLMSGNIFLDRGYTGHEHVWRAGVIDMNARIYDPIMRRFLSPDMLIQDKYNTQNYNRYGYVFNNPLIYNDPSGYAALETAIIAVAVAIVTKAFVNWINHVPIWYGLGKTFTIAVGSAIISYGIGSVATDLFSTTVTIGKAAFQAGMHGLSGGFFSELNGGKFVTGMLSSATASLVGSGMEAWGQSSSTIEIISPEDGLGIVTTFAERNQDLMTALTLVSGGLSGGFSSTIAGGNFWDGLKQGVLVVGLNHLGHFAFNFNKLERFLLKNGVTKEKMEAPATKDDIELLNKIFKVQYYDKSAKWVKMADEKTLQEWAEGYIEYVETPNGALKYKGAPQTDKPAYAVTNPINGRIIIGTGIANLNFLYFAKAYIHEMVHSINAMELIAAGKVPVADDYFDEIEAYLTEADWQGYLPKGIEPYLKQATQLFLFINNR